MASSTLEIPAIQKPDFAEKSRFKTAPKTTIKLTSLLKVEEKKDAATSAVQDAPAKPFTPEALQKVWNEFAEQRKKFQAEYQLLTQPFTLNDKTIVVHLHHPVQETMLNNLRIELSSYLREALGNSFIQIVGEMNAEEESKRVYYTNREKFEYLVEKNPVLQELKDRLGLDTDF